ncbi:UDP-glucose/GDP-mannose dehydrogenase family protein [Candidatus Pacearchaeota archaeon]|nr:MAG: UDP-glucose/GDP-mannose dehydrogenase family protein [Candidatus Pacearchaeota archaeon]
MKVGIIGVGVVGGATAEVFKRAHELYLYDKYKEPYNTQDRLDELAKNSEVVFICVPTPMKLSGAIDYSAVYNSVEQLLESVKKCGRNAEEMIVVIRSTAVSGTTDSLAKKYPFKFAFNPEFLTERNALKDMENTDRVVLGVAEEEVKEKLLALYKALFPHAKYIVVDRKTAEMIKYAANVMLASQIAIANELYQICRASGVDYELVKNAILLDERIGRNINVPGPDGDLGFGGKCFPKDLNALIYLAREHGYRPYLLESVWLLNERVRTKKDWYDIPGAVSEEIVAKLSGKDGEKEQG